MNAPRWSRALLRRLSPQAHRDDIDGDLSEWFERTAASLGPRRARRQYRRIVIATALDRLKAGVRSALRWRLGLSDVRVAARRLAAAPGFFITAVITMGLGLGVNALLFSAVNGLLLRPLPFHDADGLVWIFGASTKTPDTRDTTTGAEGDLIARHVTEFTATAAIGDAGLVRGVGARHHRWHGIWTTTGLFQVLGIAPAIGAVPPVLPADGQPRVIFISHERWTSEFGSDDSILGQPLQFEDNKRFVIAGVLPAGLEFPFARAPHKGHGAGFQSGDQDFWILAPDRPGEHPGGVMTARLAAGSSVTKATSALAGVNRALELDGRGRDRVLTAVSMRDQVLGPLVSVLPRLQAFALFVLLIACGNLGSLMLARASATRVDSDVRVALGARTSHLVRLAFAEAGIIMTAGIALSWLLAGAGIRWLAWLAPRHDALLSRITFDLPVLLMTGGIALVAAIAIGFIPVLIRSRTSNRLSAESSQRSTSARVQRSLNGLVIAQMALSVALVSGAMLLATSLHRVISVDAGYDASDVLVGETILYVPPREALPILDTLVQRLRQLPGVNAVGFVHSTPLTGQWVIDDEMELVEGDARGRIVKLSGSLVAYDYFDVMRIPVLAGRVFTAPDLTRPDFPIVINDLAAARYFPGKNPVGAHVRMTGRVREIVGVVKATRDVRLETEPQPQFYQPWLSGTSNLMVRAENPKAQAAAMRQAIESADPRFIIQRLYPLTTIVEDTVLERRIGSHLLTVFGVLAVGLAVVGLVGVIHFGAVQRRREFAVRLALGATRREVVRLVVAQAIRTTGIGISLGCMLGILVAGSLQHLVFGAQPLDWLSIAVAAALLFCISAAAATRPAWTAASVDPLAALRRN